MRIVNYIFLVLILVSCLKEENPIKPFDRGDSVTSSVSTGSNGDYSNQVFYDLSGNRVVKTNARTDWDLGFETTPAGTVVRLNTANKMQASKTGFTDFDSVMNLTGTTLDFYWDRSSGSTDSLAFKDWIIGGTPTNEVFVIDLGETPSLSSRGYKKLSILSSNSTEFVIKYANVDGSNEQTVTIPKEVNKNQTCFSFAGSGSVVNIEPNTADWDLLFTQYLHTFDDSDPAVFYSVNGVLLNPNKVKVAKVFDKPFSEITLSDVSSYLLSNQLDAIGYNWKLFDFDTQLYEIETAKKYLIQDRNGFYYKLRFIDFYNDSGIKGYPKFEFVKL